jgi:4-hydroxy-tetrahydrodipicolinate reductase
MGARLCDLARDDPRFELVAQIDLKGNNDAARLAATPVDVIIDFSSDEGAACAANLGLQHGSAVLVGTTGLSRQTLENIELASTRVAVMIAPNTSFGVAVVNHLAGVAAGLLGNRVTVNLIETHHTAKRDAPSGTALRIADTVRRAGADLPADHIHAIRSGDVVGEHTVEFASAGERIKIGHIATSRDLFVRGALDAAAWLHGRPPGRYAIEQALGPV